MAKAIIDIETIGVPFDSLDEISQEHLLKYSSTPEERAITKELTALWPVTGQVVVIGMLNPETNRGRVLFRDNETRISSWEENNIQYETGTEKEILEKFWEAVKSFQHIITFNGRGFDAPYLILRSAMLGVSITKNLMPPRFQSFEHIDLLEQFTFYGSFRKFSLHLYANAFGIPTPKDGGIDGAQITAAYQAGRYVDIAKYNARDLAATAAIYEKWRSCGIVAS